MKITTTGSHVVVEFDRKDCTEVDPDLMAMRLRGLRPNEFKISAMHFSKFLTGVLPVISGCCLVAGNYWKTQLTPCQVK